MSDQNENEDEGGSFLDHMFNALGHLSRAQKRAQSEAAEKKATKLGTAVKGGKIKRAAFDEAPRDPSSCCTSKR